MRRGASPWILLGTLALPAFAQQPRQSLEESELWGNTLRSGRLERIQDWDGDEVGDLLLGDPQYLTPEGLGRVQLRSGATFEVLWEDVGVVASFAPEHLGNGLAVLGDVDGDAFDDFAAGSTFGPLRVWSGRDLRRIHLAWDPAVETGPGSGRIGATGDVNGDGRNDLWVGGSSGVDVLEGGTFELLYRIPRPPMAQAFGVDGVALGDLDGDGLSDFAISAPDVPSFGENCFVGLVFLFSGADGAVLRVIRGYQPCDYFGQALAAVGDLNGDGTSELAISAYPADFDNDSLWVVDPSTGEWLHLLTTPGGRTGFASSVEAVGDVNGNGFGDLLVTAYDPDGFGSAPPLDRGQNEVRLVDGASGELLYAFHNTSSDPIYKPRFGAELLSFEDIDHDGFADVLVGTSGAPSPGFLERFDAAPIGVRTRGFACGSSAVPSPRIGVSGSARRGRDLPIHLTDVPSGTQALLLIDLHGDARNTGPLRALVGCGPAVAADLRIAARATPVVSGAAVATVDLRIGRDLALVGATFEVQWVVVDRNGPGVSRVLEITIQPDGPRHR